MTPTTESDGFLEQPEWGVSLQQSIPRIRDCFYVPMLHAHILSSKKGVLEPNTTRNTAWRHASRNPKRVLRARHTSVLFSYCFMSLRALP
jgi:hypothetical protein